MATAPAAPGDDSGRDDGDDNGGDGDGDGGGGVGVGVGVGLEPGAALAGEAARYARLGWMRATSGNLSVVVGTDPVRILVTASGLDKGTLTAADVVELDGAGAPTGRVPTRRPSAEAVLHARLIGLTGAGAVVHLHTVASVLAADRFPAGLTLRDHEMLKALGRAADGDPVRLPVVANSQDMAVLAGRVSAAWEPATPAVLVARHGMYVWGADLLAARHRAEAVEWLCEWAVRTAGQAVSRRRGSTRRAWRRPR
ncbi:methylthioribulose 1-phosphate dehydratase [Frankia sp. QA3]|uniref:methylthioribulose 1-phosphate dehydratase n=1 Tax=Frankia sp. QA3 TaxID=710111 RepID=UPI000269C3F1|nr:methylthioribulose 1-phosphate dehydratase [Frankia sp. QA3]EIV93836.1 methylthioribulose-1-phosphate dehydratase [Frankia sp. QA3]